MLEHIFDSYRQFQSDLEKIVRRNFFRVPKTPDDSISRIATVTGGNGGEEITLLHLHLLDSMPSEETCFFRQVPFRHSLLLDLVIGNEEIRGVCLGSIPALTSAGTFLFGDPVIERTLILRWAATKETPGHPSHLFGLYQLLREGTQAALKTLATYFIAMPPLDQKDIRITLLPSLPQMFTEATERYLRDSQLLQPLDTTNPLATISHQRKVALRFPESRVRLGSNREMERRSVHADLEGLICPIETPESSFIGLNVHLSLNARLKKERGHSWSVRSAGDSIEGVLGLSAGLIPFIEHNDMNRAMMGAKNMKQALPLLHPELPLVRTGLEEQVGRQCSLPLYAEKSGRLLQVLPDRLVLQYDGEVQPRCYLLRRRGSQGNDGVYRVSEEIRARALLAPCEGVAAEIKADQFLHLQPQANSARLRIGPRPSGWKWSVQTGDRVQAEQSLAVSPKPFQAGTLLAGNAGTLEGQLALGVNLLVAYMPWYGYNFEDAFVASRRLLDEDALTSLHFVEDKATATARLDSRKLTVGDKLTGRHGNKGVIGRIEDSDRMPRLANGTPVDLLINPHGVVSRMNLGQLFETHWGEVASKDGGPVRAAPFHPVNSGVDAENGEDGERLAQALRLAGAPDGKAEVAWFDAAGQERKARVVVGYQYFMKLNHCAEDKLNVRGEGIWRTSMTRQPTQGKMREGGQRVGEMESWALLAHMAHSNLEELLTLKADLPDFGRESPPHPLPESFRVFLLHLRALGIAPCLYERGAFGRRERNDLLDDPQARLPSFPLQIEFSIATDKAAYLASLCELDESAYLERVFRCQNPECCFSAYEGEWKKNGGKSGSGAAICPECGSLVADSIEWHRKGLMGSAVFPDGAKERWQGAVIQLMLPVPHPLFRDQSVSALYVLPPALRPMRYDKHQDRIPYEGLNRLYRKALVENKSLKDNREVGSPEWRRLAQAVEELFGKSENPGSSSASSRSRPLERRSNDSLSGRLSGKTGLIRGYLMGKRTDYSGRAVIVPDPALRIEECRLPRRAVQQFLADTEGNRIGLTSDADRQRRSDWLLKHPVLLNRQPSLHRYNILAFENADGERGSEGDLPVLAISPLVCGGFGADFDGDTMAFYLPLGQAAMDEARNRLSADAHLFSVAHGGVMLHLTQDIASGMYLFTATDEGRTTVSRLLGNASIEGQMDRKALVAAVEGYLKRSFRDASARRKALENVHRLAQIAFQATTEHGLSFSVADLQDLASSLTADERWKAREDAKGDTKAMHALLGQRLLDHLRRIEQENPAHPLAALILSGACGDAKKLAGQLARLCGGVTALCGDQPPYSYLEGLDPISYYRAAGEARREMIPKKLGTPKGGALTRKMAYGLMPVRIVAHDCADDEGYPVPRSLLSHLAGKVAAEEIGGIVETGQLLDDTAIARLLALPEERQPTSLRIRSPLSCRAEGGFCSCCYGWDLSRRELPEMDLPVGLIAAQSIGEQATQAFMKAFHGVEAQVLASIEDAKAFIEYGSLPKSLGKAKAGKRKKEDSDPSESEPPDDPESEGMRVLEWLAASVYDHKVNVRHFEALLRQMRRPGGGWRGMVEIASGHSPLAAAAFEPGAWAFVRAARRNWPDPFIEEPSPLYLGEGIGRKDSTDGEG
jgi:DNA-directed RNA polymerase subunit beta'